MCVCVCVFLYGYSIIPIPTRTIWGGEGGGKGVFNENIHAYIPYLHTYTYLHTSYIIKWGPGKEKGGVAPDPDDRIAGAKMRMGERGAPITHWVSHDDYDHGDLGGGGERGGGRGV